MDTDEFPIVRAAGGCPDCFRAAGTLHSDACALDRPAALGIELERPAPAPTRDLFERVRAALFAADPRGLAAVLRECAGTIDAAAAYADGHLPPDAMDDVWRARADARAAVATIVEHLERAADPVVAEPLARPDGSA